MADLSISQPFCADRSGATRAGHELPALRRTLLMRASALETARAELEQRHEGRAAELLQSLGYRLSSTARMRRQAHSGMDPEAMTESAGEPLEQLAGRLDDADRAALDALAASFPGLGDERDPLARLTAARLAPGPAALLLASALAGAQRARQRRLKEALTRWLTQHQGEVVISLFTFLTFGNDPQRLHGMKQLYRQAVDGCATMTELFRMLMRLPDREARLTALLRIVSFELSGACALARGARLAAVLGDIRRLLMFLSLSQICQQTAALLTQPDSAGAAGVAQLDGDAILLELIALSEQAWIDVNWLELRFGALGAIDAAIKLRLANSFCRIWKYLPLPFFDDEAKREQVLAAFDALITALAQLE